jgi:hypothetical protein
MLAQSWQSSLGLAAVCKQGQNRFSVPEPVAIKKLVDGRRQPRTKLEVRPMQYERPVFLPPLEV